MWKNRKWWTVVFESVGWSGWGKLLSSFSRWENWDLAKPPPHIQFKHSWWSGEQELIPEDWNIEQPHLSTFPNAARTPDLKCSVHHSARPLSFPTGFHFIAQRCLWVVASNCLNIKDSFCIIITSKTSNAITFPRIWANSRAAVTYWP